MTTRPSDPAPGTLRQAVAWAVRSRSWVPVALLGLVLAWATPVRAQQQTGRIVGRVTAEGSDAPISEVQVFVTPLQLGTLTRQNGTFVILGVRPGTYVLHAERIGLAPQQREVTVAANQAVEANFQMGTQALGLDEIVVTGTAGAARRREIGNTITQINTDALVSRPVEVTQMLQVAAPGVRVSALGGVMGSGASIRLRGTSSLSTSNQPIIYIDGVRMQSKPFTNPREDLRLQPINYPAGTAGSGGMVEANPLNNVNLDDIERIEVIKGSAATTLYGTEAAAGVIQIFTKRGSAGGRVWSLETGQTFSRTMKTGTDRFPYLRADPFLRTGYEGSYSASVRGGGEGLQYYVSSQYDGGSGVLPSDTIGKYGVRGNFTFSPAQHVQVQLNSAYNFQGQRNTAVGGNEAGLTHNTYRGVANYLNSEHPDTIALLWKADIRQEIERFTTGGTVTFSPSPQLNNRLTVGYDHSQQEVRNIAPFGFRLFPNGFIINDTWTNRIITLDYVGTLGLNLTERIRSNFSWGGQTIGEEEKRINGYGERFPGAAKPTLTSAATTQAFEFRSKIWNAGFFFQNVFDIYDRYFVTVGARVDGNSTFGADFGLQYYPKASVSWVVSDEGFWREGLGSLKLRAAYGQSGRAPGAFDAVRTWNSRGLGGQAALIPFNPGNPKVGPEVTSEIEAGFDGDWLNGRLSTVFTYYSSKTTGALFSVTQIPTNGFETPQRRNVGKIGNKGIEISLKGTPIQQANWSWDLGLDVTTNHSKVTSLGGILPFKLGELSESYVIEGEPAPVLRGRWVRNGDVVGVPLSSCTLPAAVADPKLPCIDNNYIFGPVQPTLTWAPSTTVRVPGGISLSARGEFRGGFYHNGQFVSGGVQRGGWMPECWDYYVNPYDGPTNNYARPTPQFTTALKPTTPALWRATCTVATTATGLTTRKADYFRLRDISAQIPVDFAFPDRFSTSVLTLQVTNGWTWYNSEWVTGDPEMGLAGYQGAWLGNGTMPPPTWSMRGSLRLVF